MYVLVNTYRTEPQKRVDFTLYKFYYFYMYAILFIYLLNYSPFTILC